MSVEVTLPALGESVTEGTVTQWLKQVGDSVETDEPLLEVSTDKVDTEIPSPASGVLLEIRASEDETVEVGAVLAVIGDASESGSSDGQQPAEGSSDEQQSGDDSAEGQQSGDDAPDQQTEQDAAAEEETPERPQPPDDKPAAPSGDGTTSVTLPELGESVTEGTVTQWLKKVGDTVSADEPLLEVSTDKVDTEIPSPTAGVLLEIKVAEDETVAVGAELAVIGAEGSTPGGGDSAAPSPSSDDAEPEPEAKAAEEPEPEAKAEEPEPEAKAEEPEPEAKAEEPEPEAEAEPAGPDFATPRPQPEPRARATARRDEGEAGERASGDGAPAGGSYVTPLVRKLAAEHGVDLEGLHGSGVGGRIRKQDVLEAAKTKSEAAEAPAPAEPAAARPAPEPSPLRGKTEKMSRLRRTIAKRMVESLQVSAQLTTVVEVDVTGIARLRSRVKTQFEQREGVKLSFLPFFAKAAIDALKIYPQLNATIDTEAGEVTYFDTENLAVAVDTERGLLTPVIKGAGDLSIAGLSRKIADLAARTRDNKITPDELSGGTFTLTNTGSRGALFDTPIINQPQVAILGTGTVVKRPVVIDDANLGETIAVRHMMYLALTYDHRLVDGADAARFLVAVKQRLEEAGFEAELGM